jgi:hypothetical protein
MIADEIKTFLMLKYGQFCIGHVDSYTIHVDTHSMHRSYVEILCGSDLVRFDAIRLNDTLRCEFIYEEEFDLLVIIEPARNRTVVFEGIPEDVVSTFKIVENMLTR